MKKTIHIDNLSLESLQAIASAVAKKTDVASYRAFTTVMEQIEERMDEEAFAEFFKTVLA